RQQRPRRPLPGMLLHIDGSEHRWFQDERWYDLLVIMDDANSEIYYAQLVEEEATVPVLAGLKEVVECRGVFCALYSDRARHFWLTAKAGEAVDHDRLTQVGRALRELGVRMIRRTRRKRAGAANAASAPGKAGCRRNCVCAGSVRWRRRMFFCASITSGSSIAASKSKRRNRAAPLCPIEARIWSASFRCNSSAP